MVGQASHEWAYEGKGKSFMSKKWLYFKIKHNLTEPNLTTTYPYPYPYSYTYTYSYPYTYP